MSSKFRISPSSAPFRIFSVVCGAVTFTAGAVMIIAAGAALVADMKRQTPVEGEDNSEVKSTGPNTWYIMLICLGVFVMFFGCLSLSCGLDTTYYRVLIKDPSTATPYVRVYAPQLMKATKDKGSSLSNSSIWTAYPPAKHKFDE